MTMAPRKTFWITLALSIALLISLSLNALIYYILKDFVFRNNVQQVNVIQYRAFQYKAVRDVLEKGDIEETKDKLDRLFEAEKWILKSLKDSEYSPEETARAATLALRRIEADQEHGDIKEE